MLKILPNTRFPKQPWEQLVMQTNPSVPYIHYDFLNLVTANRWKILSIHDRAWIPLCVYRKWGIPFIGGAPFCQHFQVLGDREGIDWSSVSNFLTKKFYKIYLPFGFNNKVDMGSFWKTKVNQNYLLHYDKPYMPSKHHLRNIAKTKNQAFTNTFYTSFQESSVQAYIKFTLANFSHLTPIFKNLVTYLAQKSYLRCAETYQNHELQAGILFMNYQGRLINLFPYTSPAGRKTRAMYALLNELLSKNPFDVKLFDFEGSNIPGVARFYEGFANQKENYLSYHYKRFSFL